MEKQDRIRCFIIDLLALIVIGIIAFSAIFTKPVSNLDEVWNFNFSRNIADGLIPYRDFNMVPTPLLSMICGLFLFIFGKELIVMRWLAVCLMCAVFFLTYKILKKIVPKEVTLLVLAVFLSLYKEVMCIDYNYAVLLVALILLYIELNHVEKDCFKYSFRYNFVVGIIAGIAVLFKQSTGLAVCVACLGYKIFEIRKKDDIKSFFRIAGTRVLGAVIPVGLLIVYLILNGAFNDFVSYTILGVRNFSNSISYANLLKNESIAALSIIVPAALLIMLIMHFVKNVKEEICIFFAYAVSSFVVAFPICDNIHFLIGAMITLIGLTYIIYEYVFKAYADNVKKKYKVFLYGFVTFVSCFFLLSLIHSSFESIKTDYILVKKENELSHFIGVPESVGLKDRIKVVDEYILSQMKMGKKVYILDAEAAIYFIPLNMYNKDYDMFNRGNLGVDGENRIIDRIKNEKDSVYLLKKDGINWQNPNVVREFVTDNLNRIDEISIFEVYE